MSLTKRDLVRRSHKEADEKEASDNFRLFFRWESKITKIIRKLKLNGFLEFLSSNLADLRAIL